MLSWGPRGHKHFREAQEDGYKGPADSTLLIKHHDALFIQFLQEQEPTATWSEG